MIDEHHQLRLDGALPVSGPKRVRIIVLYAPNGEWDETEWMRAAAVNSAFADLAGVEQDVYSLSDGKPFHDKE